MNNFINPDRKTLLHPKLIHPEYFDIAQEVLASAGNHIAECFAKHITINEQFFPNLAQVLNVEYLRELPIKITSITGAASRIPQKLLIEHQLFPYEQNNELYCATANPFLPQSVYVELLAYVGKPTLHLVISSPQEVSNAISYLCHVDATITSSERLQVLHPEKSSITYPKWIVPALFPLGFFILLAVLTVLFPLNTIFVLYCVLNILYFLVNPFKFYAMFTSLSSKKILTINQKDINQLDVHSLPMYTILVPLRDEVAMVPSIVEGIFALDYPPDKLDIKFICEVDDHATIQALEKNGIGVPSETLDSRSFSTQLVKVPKSGMSSKPKACNYALGMARGQFTVIFDAEDKPDKDQLKKVFLGFLQSPLDTMCIQAKLNFYNSRQNLLTRFFSMEYGFWYDFFLPGLQEIGSPLPLGGTSNHFVTQYLRKVGTWDPNNVTEDADLGFRIFRYRFRTSMIHSYTQEEANSSIPNWIRQRTRWQKGFLITFLVHISNPRQLYRELGFSKTIMAILTFGGNFFMPLFNPFLWILFITFVTPLRQIIPFPHVSTPIYYMGVFNLIVGNCTFIGIHLFAALKLKRYDLAIVSFFLPVYWILISLATLRAGYQYFTNPTIWEKTKHGLTR